MLTRCPACATIFRVTPEQLKVRAGTVRCGACQEVFNGIDQLVDDPALVRVRNADTVIIPPPRPGIPPASPAARETEVPLAAQPNEATIVAAASMSLDFDLSEPEPTAEPVRAIAETGDAVPPALTLDGPADVAESAIVALAESADLAAMSTAPVEPGQAAAATAPASAAPATQAPAPTRAAVRWPWTAGVTLAIILVVAQGLIHFRVELATLAPESRPLLEALCDTVGCRVGLPARVDQVGIESSDLIPDPAQKGRLTLAATLRNRAPFAQAHPLLELTLTDNANAAVARKILQPADYLPKDADLARGIAAGQDLLIQVALDAGALGATGYRLYLFYP